MKEKDAHREGDGVDRSVEREEVLCAPQRQHFSTERRNERRTFAEEVEWHRNEVAVNLVELLLRGSSS